MRLMLPDREILVRTIRIPAAHGNIPALLLSPRTAPVEATGVLWLHGGGYAVGMKEMVHMSRAVGLVKRFGAVVLAPGYPFVAAIALSCGDGRLLCGAFVSERARRRAGRPLRPDHGGRRKRGRRAVRRCLHPGAGHGRG